MSDNNISITKISGPCTLIFHNGELVAIEFECGCVHLVKKGEFRTFYDCEDPNTAGGKAPPSIEDTLDTIEALMLQDAEGETRH